MPTSNENSADHPGASNSSGAVETLEELMGPDALKRSISADLLSQPRHVQQLLDELSYSVCWKDRDGRYVGANRTMLNNLGLASSDEIKGRRSEDFFPPEAARILDESDRYVMAQGSPSRNIEQEMTSRSGAIRVVSTTKLPIFNEAGDVAGLVAYAREITERESAITALRTSEMRYSVAARASHDGIWDLDLANGTFALSKRCRKLLGLGSDRELVSWFDVARRLGRAQARSVLFGMQVIRRDSSQMLRMKVKVENDDGVVAWLEVVGAPVEIDGVVTRIVGALADVTENHLREQNLLFKATHDELTLLLNRAALTQELEKLLEGHTEFGLLSIDVDQFRFINDSLGHAAGDQVIQALGSTILEVVGNSGLVARSGGDEFAVVVHNGTQAELVATRLVQALSLPMQIGDFEMFVSATIGVVNRSLDHFSPPDLLRDVDNALYRAKKSGRGSYCVFNPAMREQADHELQLHNRIRRAVRDMEFELHYQPLYGAVDGAMVAVEALIRWRPSDADELVSPAVFLPYLERSGMILSVGRWVIDEACKQLAEWRATDSRMNKVGISVNVSRAQFRDSGLANCVLRALERNGLDASDLSLEITETVVARSIDELIDQLMAVRSLGVKVAVDDFGVGHSSLSALYDLPVDVLKIDRSFIDRIETNKKEPVTSAALDIAKSLGLETVAEGVETDEQAEWLRSSGCNVLQGYLLSRPVPQDRVIALLDANRT